MIKEVYPQIEKLSNDELRERSAGLKVQLNQAIEVDEKRIAELKEQIETAKLSISDREKAYKEIDDTQKLIVEKLEAALFVITSYSIHYTKLYELFCMRVK